MSIKCKTLDGASTSDNACTIERWEAILLKIVWSIEIDQHYWSTLLIYFPFFTKYLLSCLSWREDSRVLGPKLSRTSYRSHLWEEYSTVWGEACYNLGKELLHIKTKQRTAISIYFCASVCVFLSKWHCSQCH